MKREVSFAEQQRPGFTLVELLVVIAIIGILVALLLPAIQAAREAARRTQCGQNLGQLIVAVHNYEMAHGVYPPGTIEAKGPIQNHAWGYHHNWIIQVLPFMEEKVTYDHIDRSVGVYHPKNVRVRVISLPTLLCPSQPASRGGYSAYAGVHHDTEAPIDVDNNGVFFLNSRISYDDVTDGSAWTLFIGEKPIEQGDLGWMSGTRATLRNTAIPAAWTGMGGGRPNWAREPLRDAIQRGRVYGNGDGDMGGMMGEMSYDGMAEAETEFVPDAGTEDEATVEPPEPQPPAAPGPTLPIGGFDSPHPGGMMFACGDGHVEFISQTISATVYQQMGHRADGKLIQERDYW
jgi:prepilin-type N-terminal cleavage/methylation domain-containing protein